MCFKWHIGRLIESITNNATQVLVNTQKCGIYPRNTDTGVFTSRRTSRNRPSPSSLAPRSGRQSNQININRGKALLDTRKALVLIVRVCSSGFARLCCGETLQGGLSRKVGRRLPSYEALPDSWKPSKSVGGLDGNHPS